MSAVRRYLLALVAAALAVSLVKIIPQSKGLRRVVDLLGGTVLLITLMRPLIALRLGDPAEYLQKVKPDDALIDEAVAHAENESARLITDQTEAYILDKARALGADLEVRVELAALSEHYRYPYRATIRGVWTASQKQALSEYLSQTLGILEERQIWQEE